MQSLLSQNIKFLRKAQKLSQDALASRLGIKRSNITAYETKNVEPRLRIILEIARFFDVSIKALLTEDLSRLEYLPSFNANDHQSSTKQLNLKRLDGEVVNRFIDKSIHVRKILDGFKAFYAFKKNNNKESSATNEKRMLEIDNFIQLLEHMLVHNESLIKAIEAR